MRGRAISLSLVLFFLATAALPNCGWQPRFSAQYRFTALDVAVDSEGFVWVATGYGIQLLEPRNGSLEFADTAPLPGSTRVVALNGNLAYVGSGTRVWVVRRNGRALQVIRAVETGGTVNDIVVTSHLFVATSNNIAHFDLADPANPVRSSVSIATTRPNVTSLALFGSTLYAADGDLTVDVISVSISALPQKTGTIEALARSSAVHVMSNGMLVVSDEQTTDVITGSTRLQRIPYGSTSFVQLTDNAFFVAGNDRVLRGIDLSAPDRIAEFFEQQLAPVGGTSNRIFAMARAGNTLYAAAGDMGLVAFDIGGVIAPHSLASYSENAKTSAVINGQKAYFTDAAGVSEYNIVPSGLALTPARSWTAPAGSILQDFGDRGLLTSNGAQVWLWTLTQNPPPGALIATFRDTVRAALLRGTGVLALLADGSVWGMPFDGVAPVQATSLGAAKISSFVRASNDSAMALGEVTSDGRTIIRYYAFGTDPFSPPTRTFTLDGAAIGGIALNASYAAVFTFSGLNVIDLASGAVRVLPNSNRLLPRQLQFSGNDLLVLGDTTLAVWDAATGTLQRQHTLPATASTIDAEGSLAVMATNPGPTIIDYDAQLPTATPIFASRFYKKAVAAGEHLQLFEDGRIDVYSVAAGAAPRFVTTVNAPGAIDVAAFPQAFYTLGANGTVTRYSHAGAALAEITINEGGDQQPLAIVAAGDAVWVSIEKGCLGGTCERKTFVLDPRTLAVTATMNGGAADVAVSGTQAYALFVLPDEVRVLNIANPLQPSQAAATASPASSKSIGFSGGRVYVLADKVYAFTEALLPAGELLESMNAPNAQMRIDGGCAIVAGRAEHPEFYNPPDFGSLLILTEVPSVIRSIAVLPNRLFFLTEHSLEVWMRSDPPSPAKRRATR